jgi:hypothetical protein
MGYERHHAIVVTGPTSTFDNWPGIATVRDHCTTLHKSVSPLVPVQVNSGASFFVAPDGSKEDWDTSDEGDCGREAVLAYLRSFQGDDGGVPYSWVSWVEVQYGDDNGLTKVCASSDDDCGGPA